MKTKTKRRPNYRWLAMATAGQFLALWMTLAGIEESDNTRDIPIAIVLAITLALSTAGWLRLEEREDARHAKARFQ